MKRVRLFPLLIVQSFPDGPTFPLSAPFSRLKMQTRGYLPRRKVFLICKPSRDLHLTTISRKLCPLLKEQNSLGILPYPESKLGPPKHATERLYNASFIVVNGSLRTPPRLSIPSARMLCSYVVKPRDGWIFGGRPFPIRNLTRPNRECLHPFWPHTSLRDAM